MNLSRVMSTASRRVATVSVVGRSSSVVVANISQRGFVVATATQLLRNPEEDVAGSSRLGGLIATAAAAMGASIALANNERADCCGIAGVVGGSGDAREFLLEGLTILKNRGYDSAGIATIGDPKDGLVSSKHSYLVHSIINFHKSEYSLITTLLCVHDSDGNEICISGRERRRCGTRSSTLHGIQRSSSRHRAYTLGNTRW